MPEPFESLEPASAQSLLHDGKLTRNTEFCAIFALVLTMQQLKRGEASNMEVMNLIKCVYPSIGEVAIVPRDKLIADTGPLYEELRQWMNTQVPIIFGDRGVQLLNDVNKRCNAPFN